MAATSHRITVRERIDPEITSSLFSNYRSSAEALLELVDNAVDSRLPRQPLLVEITVQTGALIVQSQGGQGMSVRDLERNYLRWGGSPKRGKNLLGQYGQGGKAAIGHLGSRFTVEAARPGDAVAWRFTDADYRNRSRLKTYEVVETPKRVPEGVGYFRIRIDGVDKRIDARRLATRLIDTYRPLLAAGSLEIRLNSSPLKPVPLAVQERQEIASNAGGGRLRGWVGAADPDQPTPGWAPGLRCYKHGRLIAEGEFFSHPGPAQNPALVRLMGEIDIPQVALTMNKSDFDRDSAEWVEVEVRMHRLLQPLVKRLIRADEVPPPASAVKVAEQVRRLLGQALRLAERQDLFPGATPAPRVAEKSPADELPLAVEPPLREAEPSPPQVPRAGDSRRPGRKGFGNIVIRALEPGIRSTIALEEGVRVIVINSAYPLFKERHGDVWYQLETAIRELCAAEEASSVEDYENRVSEMIVTVSSLRNRRRRTGPGGAQLKLLR